MSAVNIAVRGTVAGLDARAQALLFDRSSAAETVLRERTASIITRVRANGDAALIELAQQFDHVTLTALEVERHVWRTALNALAPTVRQSFERAALNIQRVHETFRPIISETVTADGVVIGRRPDPLERVGVYAPGGRAAYPSSLLMGVIPARVAGVKEIIVCSPPGPDGKPNAVVLAAAELAGVDRLFAIGGAGAIAAMAYGTATIPRVDRIVGPGNAYVAEAKAQVARVTAIDSPAGPSELLIIADDTASPDVVTRELLAQAEHDPMAVVVLVSTSTALLDTVTQSLDTMVPREPRAEVIRTALATRGGLLFATSATEAVEFSNRFAPEHVLIATREPESILTCVRNAGTVFVGETASVAFGDYMSGANHVLPTGGLCRSYSGLSTLDFYRWTTWQRIDRAAAGRLADAVGFFADAEGLPAHAASARQWREASP